MRRLFTGCCVCLLAVAIAGGSRAGAATPGVNVELSDLGAGAGGPIERSGARWARTFLWWPSVEPAPGVFDEHLLSTYREGADRLRAGGTRLILVVVGAPAWASATGVAGGPPLRAATFAAFVRTLAARMGGSVAAYEIWNEPDIPKFWGAAPDPAAYARLLRGAYPAIKAVAPEARVLFGGLTGNDYAFLDAAYRAGAAGHFDAVAVHTDIPCELRPPQDYVRDPNGMISRWAFLGYRSVRRVMLRHHDHSPLWMTELGWATTSSPCGSGLWAGQKGAGVSEASQADHLARSFGCLAGEPYVEVALWWQMRDSGLAPPDYLPYGLLRLDGSPKPAWSAFRKVTAAGGGAPRCAAHYVGPHVSLRASHEHRSDRVAVHIHVVAELGVARIVVRLNGRVVLARATALPDADVQLPRRLRGRHDVKAVAYDTANNGGRASLRLDL